MSAEDYIFDDYEPWDEDEQPSTCYRCGTRDLYWAQRPDGRWFLPHECTAHIASPDDFEDLTL